jgi:prepilin-type N-terminal cleavage/methylation domain-containing protein
MRVSVSLNLSQKMKVHPSCLGSAWGRAAFTLVEVIVAAAILGILMIVFFAGYAQGYFELNTSREDLRATQILTQKAETIRLCTWTNLLSLPTTFVDYYTDSSATNGQVATYYGTISVSAPTNISSAATYYDDIKLVTIGVTWTNYLRERPVAHYRQIQTMAAKNGMVNYLFGYFTLTNTP